MSETRRLREDRTGRPGAEDAAPQTAEEALRRARIHLQNALAEALLAARALLDAASLGTTRQPAGAHSALAPLIALLEDGSRRLASERPDLAGPLVEAILDALDLEIRRWEGRARDDAEARAVLRAFMGVREILWEFGLRRPAEPESRTPESDREAAPSGDPPAERTRSTAEAKPRRDRRRVQRVRVQG